MRILFTCFCLYISSLYAFDKVVIWGHKLHSHTHSYIHQGFYKAFQALGYETYWLDHKDHIESLDFSNALFLTEGQVDQNIPLTSDGFYILHNCDMSKYKEIVASSRYFILQVYTDDVLMVPTANKVAPCIYEDLVNQVLYMPWATDLLPEEIEQEKLSMRRCRLGRYIAWVGTIGDGRFGNREELSPFIEEAKKSQHPFLAKTHTDAQPAKVFCQQAYMAPTIVGTWQKKQGYIPCRIFKNVSYGVMGITNSYRVYELFNEHIVYDPDSARLFRKAEERLKTFTQREREELMDFVKDHHTYINRVNTLLNFMEKMRR